MDVSVDYVSVPPDFSGFGAPDRAKEIAERMMADGVDVIYTAAGGSGAGSLEAIAARKGSGPSGWTPTSTRPPTPVSATPS
nr:hypothetical protein GCM10020093_118670 [Planobispora longispora]